MIFPRHACGLHLTHNQHKDYYESIEQYFKNPWMEDIEITDEEKQLMIDSNEIWELQWYPDTPIGSYKLIGHDFDNVLYRAIELQKQVDVEALKYVKS